MGHTRIYSGGNGEKSPQIAIMEQASDYVGDHGFVPQPELLRRMVQDQSGQYSIQRKADGLKVHFDQNRRGIAINDDRTGNGLTSDVTNKSGASSTVTDGVPTAETLAAALPSLAAALAGFEPFDDDDMPMLKLALNLQAEIDKAQARRNNPARGMPMSRHHRNGGVGVQFGIEPYRSRNHE